MAKVNWTFQALEDLDEIGERLSLNSSKYASYIVDLCFERGNYLKNFPKMGRVVPELGVESIREIIVKNYRIIYSIVGIESVEILTVRHSSRPLADSDF